MQTEVNVEQDDIIVNNVVEVGVVITNVVQSGGDRNVELCGSETSSNPSLINDGKGVSSRTKFDNDSQDTNEDYMEALVV